MRQNTGTGNRRRARGAAALAFGVLAGLVVTTSGAFRAEAATATIS